MSYSGLKLLLDQGVPRDAADLLRQAGVDCTHVGELGLSKAEDGAIVALARQCGAVVVTLDADFHTILAVTGADGPSTIRLRLQGVGGSEAASLVVSLIERFADEKTAGLPDFRKGEEDHLSHAADRRPAMILDGRRMRATP